MTFSRGTESLSICSPKEEPAGNTFFLPSLPPISGWWYLLLNPTRRQKAWSTQEISLLRHRAGWRIMESRYGGQQGLLSLENTVRFLAPRIQYSGVLEVSNYEKSDMFVIDNQIEEISKEQFMLRVARIKSFLGTFFFETSPEAFQSKSIILKYKYYLTFASTRQLSK